MATNKGKLPCIGDIAPAFVAKTQKGAVRFPEDFRGSWCVFFCHPANYTSGWRMYSDYLMQKERWLQERNTRLLVLSNQTVCGELWSDVVSRYFSLCLKAPIIEDTDNLIADLYGMSPSKRIAPPAHRLLYIIDPESTIRHIVYRPMLSIKESLTQIAETLQRLQDSDSTQEASPAMPLCNMVSLTEERLAESAADRKGYPPHWHNKKINLN